MHLCDLLPYTVSICWRHKLENSCELNWICHRENDFVLHYINLLTSLNNNNIMKKRLIYFQSVILYLFSQNISCVEINVCIIHQCNKEVVILPQQIKKYPIFIIFFIYPILDLQKVISKTLK